MEDAPLPAELITPGRPRLGGTETFALPLVGRILAVNAAARVGLHVLRLVGAAVALSNRPVLSMVTPTRPASL